MSIRNAIACVFAAVALVLVPTSAMAYNGDAEGVAVTDANPAVGESFQVIVDAGTDSDSATLTISGVAGAEVYIDGQRTRSLTKSTTGAGTAEFTVRIEAEGTFALVGLDAEGNQVGSSTVVVGDSGTVVGGDVDQAGVALPATGSSSSSLVIGAAGALLLVGGGATLLYSRRRHNAA